MASKIDHVILDGLNYAIWEPDMETMMKSKAIQQYTKTVIPNPSDDQAKFIIDGNKDETVGLLRPISLRRYDFTPMELISLVLFGRR